jgi:hypothetical protein
VEARTVFDDKVKPLLDHDKDDIYKPSDLEARVEMLQNCVDNRYVVYFFIIMFVPIACLPIVIWGWTLMKVWNNFILGQHIIKALLLMLAMLFFLFFWSYYWKIIFFYCHEDLECG